MITMRKGGGNCGGTRSEHLFTSVTWSGPVVLNMLLIWLGVAIWPEQAGVIKMREWVEIAEEHEVNNCSLRSDGCGERRNRAESGRGGIAVKMNILLK